MSGRPSPRRTDACDGALDLFLGGSCLGCRAPGRVLCAACRDALPDLAAPRWPTPVPPGLATPYAVAPYDGLVRDLVLFHKERGLAVLSPVLGSLLARSVLAALETLGPGDGRVLPVVLVPVPSRAAGVRARGRDATWEMTVRAARSLNALAPARYSVTVARLLRSRRGVRDQAGLDVEERRANLDGSMACSSAALGRLARRVGSAHVVVCDDVLTTGATLGEAQRALAAVGLDVLAHACVAATPRRDGGSRAGSTRDPRGFHG